MFDNFSIAEETVIDLVDLCLGRLQAVQQQVIAVLYAEEVVSSIFFSLPVLL